MKIKNVKSIVIRSVKNGVIVSPETSTGFTPAPEDVMVFVGFAELADFLKRQLLKEEGSDE